MTNQGLSDLQRKQIEEMRQRSVWGYRAYPGISLQDTEELPAGGSSFSVRLMIALLLLAVFMHFHVSGKNIASIETNEAIEAVCQDTDLQKALDSVKMEQ